MTALLLVNIVVLACLMVMMGRVKRVYNDILDFFTPEKAGEPSPFGKVLKLTSDQFAYKIVDQAKMTLMGMKGNQANQEKAVEGAIAVDALSQSPLAATALTAFPELKKLIRKNPGLAEMGISKLLGKVKTGSNGQVPAHSSNTDLEV